MTETELVGLGGLIGIGVRLGLGLLVGRSLAFPYGALVTNAVGPSLLVVSVHLMLKSSLPEEARVAIATAALAGFMVLATFNRQTMKLIADGARAKCLAIMASAAIGCLIAGGLGLKVARAIV